MSYDGVVKAKKLLSSKKYAGDAIEIAIKDVENNPSYTSVGYGGVPNEHGEVEMDAAFMNGDNFSIGAIAGIKDFENPICIAKALSKEKYNNFLIGAGAEEFAHINGFERKNMLSEKAKETWIKKKEEVAKTGLSAYDGHDTVCMVSLDSSNSMVVGTSTSGLFMKKKGRVGDSPIAGSGFYVDSNIGGAAATGLGEDITKSCISYEIVRLMEEGVTPQEACDTAIFKFTKKYKEKNHTEPRHISVVAMNNKGQWGAGTNLNGYTFVVATNSKEPTIYVADYIGGKTKINKKYGVVK
ncbi:N(4)-(beta-N-acetylglucosaminyl)-L-asparaginase [Clostridium tarantellae]|uniref:N(4)-(Beta-N-acetylglucosaminyl)-L-asparaginase n=2 Tax=Clostridium tarantellae TaxID=39493 RepID=A0A6I1MMX8_9CLOT|nr:N(4)-(beta-N-acetylglucosaminyl)-L-asparaginase [Clostridium tarantellae]